MIDSIYDRAISCQLEEHMAPNQLFAAINRQPFHPFRLHLSDGAVYDVRHPEFCLVGIRTTEVVIPPPDDTEGSEKSFRIDNLHITQLEQLPMPVNPTANGQTS